MSARLADAARMARQALGADHASVLLLDDLGRLVPAVAVARTEDAVLWSRFLSMPPVRLDSIPIDVSAITTGRPIVINDVQSSALVPEPWRISFGVQSAAVAPLLVDGVPCGALVVDYAAWPHEFSENDVRLLEAMAAPVSYLLGVAGVAEGARRTEAVLDRVTAAGRELAAARTGHAVLQAALAGLAGVVGGTECSLHVVTGDIVETLASHGRGRPDPGRYPVGALDDVSRRALRAVEADPARPVLLPGRPGEEHVVVPMTDARDAVRAFAVVGRDRVPPLTAVELAAAGDVAAQAWHAYERAGESARLARRAELLDAVRALADDPLLEPDLPRIVERLAPAVRSTTGAELLDAFLFEPAAARLFATPAPPRRLAPLFRRWRRGGAGQPVLSDDVLVVPMVADDLVVGALRVRGAAEGDVPDLLCSVAGGVGAAVARVLQRRRMAEHERGLAVAEERERVARDLHDTLGQQLFALRVELEGVAATVHDRLAAAKLRAAVGSVTRANADLRLAIHALSFLEQAKRGLVPSVRTLVRKIGETTPIGLQLRVVGTPVRLAHGREEALFRVTHEALENVVRHSRASTATVTVSYSPERAAVIVRDDGTGMSARSDEQHGLHFGLRTMQRRMEEIGGGLEVSNFRPHGVCLHAWVPTR
ncbi:MAG TPA: GAF domain-containing protein [Frankiaceae bacterium]|nr:GAF domain-containing protein [Frankiaceae bacterium]